MAIEKCREYFKKWNMDKNIREFSVSSATVELAAEALNCDGARIAKTMAFMVGDKAVLVVTAGDAKIDNSKYKSFFKSKAKMLNAEQLDEYIGHAMGGVCPFGINENVNVYLDVSLKRFETVFPACGSDNSAIELTIDELYKYSNSLEWVDVCKNW